MCPIRALNADVLARRCDTSTLPFETTASAPRTEEFLGQEQAIEALEFGVAVRRDGYNLFAVGPPGVGKQSILRQVLARKAAEDSAPDDWCYVHNFVDPRRPKAIRLPAGRAARLKADMSQTVSDLKVAMRAAFEGEEFRTRKQSLARELEGRQDRAFRNVERRAKELGVSVVHEQDMFRVNPLRAGKPLSPAEYDALGETEQNELTAAVGAAEDALQQMLQDFNDWRREHQRALRALERTTAATIGAQLFEPLRATHAEFPAVTQYLTEVEKNLADSVEEFLDEEDSDAAEDSPWRPVGGEAGADYGASFEVRATVNVLVDHSGSQGAPVVYADHPTYANLVGRIEHAAQFGSLIPDFTLLRGGALHRARGGYLLLDASRLLENTQAWEALKRTLRSHEIVMEPAGQQADATPTLSLEPQPIPFSDTKLILLGDRELYDMLVDADPDFLELFKVLVEFDERMERSLEAELRYANLLAWLAAKDGLRDFTRCGISRLLDYSSRLAEDAGKLSVRMRPVMDLMREADTRAGLSGCALVKAEHVQAAAEAQLHRAGRIRDRILEDVRNGVTLIACEGHTTGQVNGLSVVRSGDHSFGLTVRITAQTWVGSGDVVDIEREVELGGPLHAKGVLILRGFLGARYAREAPLSLSASLVFEQSYGAVEGDSASLAEACVLLSALAEIPIRQNLAITGSMNQRGDVQAIGGVNEKIEGFFDVCAQRGLTGNQGAVIPASNTRHLMLRADVVQAVHRGQFHVWTVETLDDALELLMGVPAGERDAAGQFPADSVNGRAQRRLRDFAESNRLFRSRQA